MGRWGWRGPGPGNLLVSISSEVAEPQQEQYLLRGAGKWVTVFRSREGHLPGGTKTPGCDGGKGTGLTAESIRWGPSQEG